MSIPSSVEVLAPAGSPESLEAAVRAGADAVYLGGSSFSARASAKNFSNEQLRQAVEFCHGRGVKVYLTVNIPFVPAGASQHSCIFTICLLAASGCSANPGFRAVPPDSASSSRHAGSCIYANEYSHTSRSKIPL